MTAGDEELETKAPKFHIDRSAYADRFATWLDSQWPAASQITVTDVDIPVATGFSNETVFLTVHWIEDGVGHEQRMVARIEPTSAAIFPTQTEHTGVSVGLQFQIMDAVARNSDVPITPLIAYEPDPEVVGQPFFLMEFVNGVIPADQPRYSQEGFLVDDATPQQRRRMIESGLEAMAGIHAIDWRQAGLEWLDPTGGNPTQADQLAIYREMVVSELAGREHPVLMAALDWLDANDPNDDRIGLTWGDARLGNIIWQDYEAAAVVDWEACALSPTEADVGWWLMFDRMSFDDLDAERMEGFPTREEMVAIYEASSGKEVRDPHYWEVFATMRFCAIFIRLGDRMVGHGLLPESMNPAVGNQVTDALAALLEMENPTPNVL